MSNVKLKRYIYFNIGKTVENIRIRIERKYKPSSKSKITDCSIDISFEIMQMVFIFIIGKYILMQNKINDKDNNNLFVIRQIDFMKIMTFSKSVS